MNFRDHRYSTESGIGKFARALRYVPETGELIWNDGFRGAYHAAGHLTHQGYRYVTVAGHQVAAHRLVWALEHGDWPVGMLDHINGNKDDNRIENLRECTHQGNAQNTSAQGHRRLLPKGVLQKNPKWHGFESRITHKGRTIYLGYYDTAEEAHAAYLAAKAELHTFQPTPRGSHDPGP